MINMHKVPRELIAKKNSLTWTHVDLEKRQTIIETVILWERSESRAPGRQGPLKRTCGIPLPKYSWVNLGIQEVYLGPISDNEDAQVGYHLMRAFSSSSTRQVASHSRRTYDNGTPLYMETRIGNYTW